MLNKTTKRVFSFVLTLVLLLGTLPLSVFAEGTPSEGDQMIMSIAWDAITVKDAYENGTPLDAIKAALGNTVDATTSTYNSEGHWVTNAQKTSLGVTWTGGEGYNKFFPGGSTFTLSGTVIKDDTWFVDETTASLTKDIEIIVASDTTPPVISSSSHARTGANTGTITLTSDEEGTASVYDMKTGLPIKTTTVTIGENVVIIENGLPETETTVSVRVTDSTGNMSNALSLTFPAYGTPAFEEDTKTINNDVETLGLVGTIISNTNTNVALSQMIGTNAGTAILITSRSAGDTIIRMQNNAGHAATIPVTVAANGAITIGTIEKYVAPVNKAAAPTEVTLSTAGLSFKPVAGHLEYQVAVFKPENANTAVISHTMTYQESDIKGGVITDYIWNHAPNLTSGNYLVSLVTKGINGEDDSDRVESSVPYVFNKPAGTLPAPTNLRWEGKKAMWNAVDGDNVWGYLTEFYTQGHTFFSAMSDTVGVDFSREMTDTDANTYTFKVYTISSDITAINHSAGATSAAYAPAPTPTRDSSSSSSSGSVSNTPSMLNVRPNEPTAVTVAAATNAAEAAVKAATASGASTAKVALRNPSTISLKALKEVAKVAGMPAIINADSIANNGATVDVRITLDPAKATTALNLAASTSNSTAKARKSFFEKWFSNKVSVVSLGQQGSFGTDVTIATKVGSNLDSKTLVFYAYDKATNSFQKIANPNYRVDKNGYVHFTTRLAGDIIITDKALTAK